MVAIPDLIADECWNAVHSSAPWLSWQLALLQHGLLVSLEIESTSSVLDLLILGGCPGTIPSVLLDLCVALAPYLRSANADKGFEYPIHTFLETRNFHYFLR